jgi:hypothetical protein
MYGLREKARRIELRQQIGPHNAGGNGKYGLIVFFALVVICVVMVWIANR